MYLIRSCRTWEGAVANSSLDRATKYCLLTLASRLPAYGTVSLEAKRFVVGWLTKACEMTEEQVEKRLTAAARAGFLKTTTNKDRSVWTLELTYPRPALESVVNFHQDAVTITTKSWDDVLNVLEMEGAKE